MTDRTQHWTEHLYINLDLLAPFIVIYIVAFIITIWLTVAFTVHGFFKKQWKESYTKNGDLLFISAGSGCIEKFLNVLKLLIYMTPIKANSLITALYGGKYGFIREKPRDLAHDDFGRQRMYIDEHLIPENLVVLPLMLTIKCVLLFSCIAFVFWDQFLVHSWAGCDPDQDCYFHNPDYDGFPVLNCSEALGSNYTTTCYRLAYDFSNAAAKVGGFLTTSMYANKVLASASIQVYTFLKKYNICSRCTESMQIQFFLLQYISVTLLIVFPCSLFMFKGCDVDTGLHYFGCVIQRFAYVSLIVYAFMVPWYHLVIHDHENGQPKNSYEPVGGINDGDESSFLKVSIPSRNYGGDAM